MTWHLLYEVQRTQYAEDTIELSDEDMIEYQALPDDRARTEWRLQRAQTEALYEDEWDSQIDNVQAYVEERQ